jgi:hypothetical protein
LSATVPAAGAESGPGDGLQAIETALKALQAAIETMQTSEAGRENRLRGIEGALEAMKIAIEAMQASVTILGRDFGHHVAHAGDVGAVVEKSALVVEASARRVQVSSAHVDRELKRFSDLHRQSVAGIELAEPTSELAQPVPESGMAERSRKDAEAMRFRRDLLLYGVPLLGIVVLAFAVLPLRLRLPLTWVVLSYVALILVGGSLAAAWVVSAFREEILKRRLQRFEAAHQQGVRHTAAEGLKRSQSR